MKTTILIAGGYGVVGSQIAAMFAVRNPDIHVLIAGRSLEKAQAMASTLPNAAAVALDVMADDPLAGVQGQVDAIIVAVNDHHDNLLRAAMRRSIPLADVARWTARLIDAEALAANHGGSPVVLASGWMAGAVSTTIANALDGAPARHVDVDILFGMADKAGPDSVMGFVNMHRPFAIHDHGKPRSVRSLTDGRVQHFPNGRKARVRRFSSPDQHTLVASGIAKGAAFRMAFDSPATMASFVAMVRIGLWGILPASLREKLLHNPGQGDAHQIVITGTRQDGSPLRVTIADPLGQTHMTAAASVSQAERLLGLQGRIRPAPGVSYPEQAIDVTADTIALVAMGVELTLDNMRWDG